MLNVQHMTISFGSTRLFDDTSLLLERGEILGLVAPNGYGKTTLMRAIAGQSDAKVHGVVVADDVDQGDAAAFRRNVFYVPGDGSILYPNLTVLDHLKMTHSLWKSPYDPKGLAHRCGIDGFLNKRVSTLSLGMRQQAALAVAYMTNAPYLLLDEPMNALDPTNVLLNSTVLRHLAAKGAGLLVSSHILDTIDALCDAILFIQDGKLIREQGAGAGVTSMDWYTRLYVRGGGCHAGT